MSIIEDRLSVIRTRFEVGAQARAATLESLIASAQGDGENGRRAIGEFCHSLAGLAGMLGYRDIGEAAAEVDSYARNPSVPLDLLLAMAGALSSLIRATGPDAGTTPDADTTGG